MADKELPPHFLARLNAVTAKRARTVIDHILAHGQVSTEELRELYGYEHGPPGRAGTGNPADTAG